METKTTSKVHENFVRRMAARQKLSIRKINRRDTLAHDRGLWYLVRKMVDSKPRREIRGSVDVAREVTLTPEPITLAEIERILLTPKAERPAPVLHPPPKTAPRRLKGAKRAQRQPVPFKPDAQLICECQPYCAGSVCGNSGIEDPVPFMERPPILREDGSVVVRMGRADAIEWWKEYGAEKTAGNPNPISPENFLARKTATVQLQSGD
ncbi:MAG: hypothetical protein HY269_06965 [Deltaproteobacteria bacterium]|nr:hypothetical protein [Deltaproteobacteria bacterium]